MAKSGGYTVMIDTRETMYHDAKYGPYHQCRFEPGDVLVHPVNRNVPVILTEAAVWDIDRGGWCVVLDGTRVHESNFVRWDDAHNWDPHVGNTAQFSWWTLKDFSKYARG
jgi:hypothetical protein